jgi:hypothetical protein
VRNVAKLGRYGNAYTSLHWSHKHDLTSWASRLISYPSGRKRRQAKITLPTVVWACNGHFSLILCEGAINRVVTYVPCRQIFRNNFGHFFGGRGIRLCGQSDSNINDNLCARCKTSDNFQSVQHLATLMLSNHQCRKRREYSTL